MIGKSLLRCVVDNREFAIRADEVRHVARADQLRPDDNADGRLGSVTIGGHNLPVFAMSDALGLTREGEAARHPDQHIAVTGDTTTLVGWLVDRISRTTTEGRIAALPPAIGGRARVWFDGVVILADDESPLLLIAPRRLDPLHAAATPPIESPASDDAPVPEAATPAQPVALIFSTGALPESSATRFALSGRQVAAITQPASPIGVPGSAPHVAGMLMWRNSAVPVFDFRATKEASQDRRQLIARCKSEGRSALIAFSIDPDVAMHRPDADDRCLSELPCPPFATGLFDIDGEVVALLNTDALVEMSTSGR